MIKKLCLTALAVTAFAVTLAAGMLYFYPDFSQMLVFLSVFGYGS